jgi:hypothetical protein
MNLAIRILSDPKLFNCIILGLYTCAAIRWFVAGRFGDGMYWVSAFMITFTVTFLMGGK